MTRSGLAALALLTAAFAGSPVASAAPGDEWDGGCDYQAVAIGSDHFTGQATVRAVLYSTTGGPTPTATVSCVFVFADHIREVGFTGTGLVYGSERVDYDGYGTLWDLCTKVQWAGETGYTIRCGDYLNPEDPVYHYWDTLPVGPSPCETFDLLDALTPDDPTVVIVDGYRETYVGGRRFSTGPPWC